MKKLIDGLLTVAGVAALLEGWRRFKTDLPKPTQDKQVTRTDYLSGNYERELSERDEEIKSQHRRGVAFLGAGVGFLLAGVYMLARIIKPPTQEE